MGEVYIKNDLSTYSYILYVSSIIDNSYCFYSNVFILYIHYLCNIIYHSSIQYNLLLFFSLFKIQEHNNYFI